MPTFSVAANLTFLYYADLARAISFYQETLGLKRVVEQSHATIFQVTPHSFIGLVDGTHGTHKPSPTKPVIVSFITDDVEQWHTHLTERGVPLHRPLQTVERVGVHNFMVLDPEGYILEFETFLDQPYNHEIRAALALK